MQKEENMQTLKRLINICPKREEEEKIIYPHKKREEINFIASLSITINEKDKNVFDQ